MPYFIAYVAKGPLVKYHHALVEDLTLKFRLQASEGLFPTHWTLKAPFEVKDIVHIRAEIQKFAESHHSFPFTINNFGHFGKDVIFLEVALSEGAVRVAKGIQNALAKQVQLISWSEHEPFQHFHITIAKNGVAEKFENIWTYLKKRGSPNFNLLFDSVVLLRRENNKWVVDSVYPLNP